MTFTYQQIIDRMIGCNAITPSGQINKQIKAILRSHPTLYDAILMATMFLPPDTSIRARIYAIRADIHSPPVCETCGKVMKFNEQTGKFNSFCPKIKGSSCVSASDRVRFQQERTMIDRYGVPNPSKSRELCEKRMNTVVDRYGGTSPMASSDVRSKQRATLMAKYGVDTISDIPGVSDARKATNLDRFGATTFAGGQVPQSAINALADKQYCEDNIRDFTIDEIAQMLQVSSHTVRKYLAVHGIDATLVNRNCSSPERELMRFLEMCDIKYEYNNRTVIYPKQVDFLIPSHKLAIEYDGIYYHSELNGRHRTYHRDKMIACNNAGYRLIHIFSSEWHSIRHIVLSRLKNALGLTDTLYARKCTIRTLSIPEAQVFFNTTHIQGFASGAIYLGLEKDGVVVAAMSFCRSRFNKQYEWELLRYSSALNVRVVGGASKLFKHFIRTYDPSSVISYCDLRWGTGKLYQALGFTEAKVSPPNYFYFKSADNTNTLLSRQVFQKHKLPSKLDVFNPDLTEWENMQANGYDRIWDCGNGVWVWTK